MSKTKTRIGSRTGMVLLALVALGGVGLLAAYVQQNAATIPYEQADAKGREHLERLARNRGETLVPKPVLDESGLHYEKGTAPIAEGDDAKLTAVRTYLSRAKLNETGLVRSVRMRERIALVDFSPGFNEAMGSLDEAAFLGGLRATLGQFTDVDAVEISVNGETITELGHIEIDAPMPVIRPENWKSPPAKSGATPAPSEPN